jgi:cytidine deaminase
MLYFNKNNPTDSYTQQDFTEPYNYTITKNGLPIQESTIVNIIDELVQRRLILNTVCSIDQFPMRHTAAFITTQPNANQKVAIGENSMREAHTGCCYGSHAEMDAIRKLPPRYGSKRKTTVDLVVVRVGKNGNLKNSAPCCKCLEHLNRLNLKTSYKLKYIYYSDATGNVIKIKFTDLLLSEHKHFSLRFRPIKKE